MCPAQPVCQDEGCSLETGDSRTGRAWLTVFPVETDFNEAHNKQEDEKGAQINASSKLTSVLEMKGALCS